MKWLRLESDWTHVGTLTLNFEHWTLTFMIGWLWTLNIELWPLWLAGFELWILNFDLYDWLTLNFEHWTLTFMISWQEACRDARPVRPLKQQRIFVCNPLTRTHEPCIPTSLSHSNDIERSVKKGGQDSHSVRLYAKNDGLFSKKHYLCGTSINQ